MTRSVYTLGSTQAFVWNGLMPELQERCCLIVACDWIWGRLFCHLSFFSGQAPARLSFFLLCRRKSVLWEKWQGTSRMRWCGKCFTWVVTWLCLVWQMFPRSFGLETDLLLEKSYNEKNEAAVEYVYFSSGSSSTLASDGRWKGNWSVFIRTGKRKLGNMASSNNHDFDE